MNHILILLCLLVSWFTYVMSYAGAMIGAGRWKVINAKECPDQDQYPLRLDIKRKKMNRTHDGFDIHFDFEHAIDDSYAVRIDTCKYVDGGCKPYQVLADDSFEHFINVYALENMVKILGMMELDPPNLPIPEGVYDVSGYIFDYTELPDNGIIGIFGAQAYLIKDNSNQCCVDLTVEFKPNDDDD